MMECLGPHVDCSCKEKKSVTVIQKVNNGGWDGSHSSSEVMVGANLRGFIVSA